MTYSATMLASLRPGCMECGSASLIELVDGVAIYPHRPDLLRDQHGTIRRYWRCECGAYVGCHPGTIRPLGDCAGKETRTARSAAHAAFDPMWRTRAALSGISKTKARGRGYRWLAAQLGIEPKDCHIGMMDAATAWRVVEICHSARTKKTT